ncbi:FAS1 domain-containing protein [Rhizophagus irregularis]|uniref:FAS1 domain-containing protein n=1 Tax=Rhizophagus irregularis TaxID=588596 RepID=A0A2N0RM14_9GLOM|nr:FAS1 domain-containing protein [Rhizophagus irregularis]PKC64347.1 FAS1 domain-containing protein [Rhizophagus irregularis]CAB4482894.1 unnamed protein product [Rhizophagus irregularis]
MMILKFLTKISVIIFFLQTLLISIITAQDVTKNLYDNIVADGPQLLALGAVLNTIPKFVTTLKSVGPYTFFAPSNNAFESINATPDEIEQILNYHLIPGKFLLKDFPSISYPKSMFVMAPPATGAKEAKGANVGTGQPIVVEKLPAGGIGIKSGLTSANVLVVDQVASNGVIHIVDKILELPKTPMQTLLQSDRFKSMAKILQSENYGNLADEIAKVNDVGVTILALTDEVIFNSAPKEIAKNLSLINPIFSYHIIPKQIIYSGSVENVVTAKTLKDEIITFTRDNGELYVGNAITKAKIIQADLITYNGVLHVINNVLIPPNIQITPEGNPTVPLPSPSPSVISTKPPSSPSESPKPIPVENSSSNVGIIVASALGGIVGGGLIMLGGFFLIYKKYIKKAKNNQGLFPYTLGHNNINSQPSHYSNYSNYSHTNSNDNYSVPTTNRDIRSLYIGSE